MKRYVLVCVAFLLIYPIHLAFAQTPTRDCPLTIKAWKMDVSLRQYLSTRNPCYCPTPTSRPVCTLKPFAWGSTKLELKPIGTATFDTSGYTSWQRLLCSAHFSGKALDAARGGNPEEARFMNMQSEMRHCYLQ